MKRVAKLISKLENTADATMQIYDICNTKKDYKKFYKFVSKQYKEFIKLDKEGNRVYQVKFAPISDKITVTSIIRNCNPESVNDALREVGPMEIWIDFTNNENGHNIHTNGTGFYGGCNEAEISEFLTIIKDGISDFTKEEIR